MAVASEMKHKTSPSTDSLRYSPSKNGSEAGSETSAAADLSDHNDQSESSSQHHRRGGGDVDILLSPAYLKSEEYRLLFHLPPHEVLVQDFNCAFQESILLQGHMYLFASHICFYSNIFGFETKKTIPFHEVACVRKAKTAAIFPNAIEIVAGGKKHFFASFLSRDEAYRLIVDGWSQSINGANVLIDRQESKSEIRGQDDELVIVEDIKSFQQPTNDLYAVDRKKDTTHSGKLLSNIEDDESTSKPVLGPQENGEDTEAVVNAECSCSGVPSSWKLEDADAPKVPDYFTKVAESKFPIQVEEFFNLYFSDYASIFTETFHRRCGDKDFKCTSWYDHEQFGHAREVSFQHPIKIYFGAKFGSCQDLQKYRVYRNSTLVIETSQEISDVPYGDYFRVEGLWVVESDGTVTNNCCILRVYVNVNFSKKTMWKGKIEQSTVEECREAYSLWLNTAHERLKQKNLENVNDTCPAPHQIHSNLQLEPNEDQKGPESLHDARNVPQIPVMASHSQDVNSRVKGSVHGNPSSASFSASLFGDSLTRLCLYLRNQVQFPLVLVVASVLMLLLMQLSIIVLLTRAPQVHVVSQVEYMNNIASGRGDEAEAVAWLEKQVHHLKDEMSMVEARLEKMRHEHVLLKGHLKAFEQLKE